MEQTASLLLRRLRSRLGSATIAAAAACALTLPASAAAQAIGDDFEAATLGPGWEIIQQHAGTISLSTDQNHTSGGQQSLKFESANGNQRYMIARRHLGAPTKGVTTIYFYDAAPGQETLYVNFSLANTASNVWAALGTQDFDAFCYKAFMTVVDAGTNFGPNANCGVFPRTETTNVPRTAGWHKFTIDNRGHNVVFSIDAVTVYTFPSDFAFDMIQLDLSGPVWRPNTVAYFDDFSFAPAALCDIQLSQTIYTSGNTVSAPVFRLANNTTGTLATEIKAWIGVPGVAPASLINLGSVVLPAGMNVNLGPINLFQVTPATTKGVWEFSCRFLEPATGTALSTSLKPFVIQ